MRWKLCVTDTQGRALALCRGSMDEGNGWGYGAYTHDSSGYGSRSGAGKGWGYGYGKGWGCGDGGGYGDGDGGGYGDGGYCGGGWCVADGFSPPEWK